MTIAFKQIRPDKNIDGQDGMGYKILVSVFITSWIVFLIWEVRIQPIVVLGFVLFLLWLSPKFRKLLGDFSTPKDVIGTVIFDKDSMQYIDASIEQCISTAVIQSLELRYNYIQGKHFQVGILSIMGWHG